MIVKLTSYETRKVIYTKKRKFKGTRYVVTENLTKRRAEHIAHDNIKNLKYENKKLQERIKLKQGKDDGTSLWKFIATDTKVRLSRSLI